MSNPIQRAKDILAAALAERDLRRGDLHNPYTELLFSLALDVANTEDAVRAEVDLVRGVVDRVAARLDEQPQLLNGLGELQGNGPRFDVRVAVLEARRHALATAVRHATRHTTQPASSE